MAIHVRHTYCTHVEIIFQSADGVGLHEATVGDMDEILEHVCDVLVHHGFSHADVCSAETGEILMEVERT